MADAYCLLEVYTVLKSNPAQFGLPEDLQNISSGQAEKSKDKKPKEQQRKQTHSKEVSISEPFTRAQSFFYTSPLSFWGLDSAQR